MSFFNFSHIVGIDMGSFMLRILKDDRVVFNERASMARDRTTNKMVLLGNSVYEHNHESIVKYEPIDYVIADFAGAEQLVNSAVKKTIPNRFFLAASLISYTTVPTSITEVEKRAYRDSLEHMNSKAIYLIYSPVAIAIGQQLLFEKRDIIIVDFSASKVEITVFHDAEIIAKNHVRFGVIKLKKVLQNHIKRNYKVAPSDDHLTRILQNYTAGANEKTIKIQNVSIPMSALQIALERYLLIAEDMLLECLESIDVIIRAKVLRNGLFFSGGGAYYKQICKRFANSLETGYSMSSSPELDVINGLKLIIRDPKKYSAQLMQ